MKVYFPEKSKNKRSLVHGTSGIPLKIERARLFRRPCNYDEVGLVLDLRELDGGRVCTHLLVGGDYIREFAQDAKISKLGELIGREVIGLVPPVKPDYIQALSLRN